MIESSKADTIEWFNERVLGLIVSRVSKSDTVEGIDLVPPPKLTRTAATAMFEHVIPQTRAIAHSKADNTGFQMRYCSHVWRSWRQSHNERRQKLVLVFDRGGIRSIPTVVDDLYLLQSSCRCSIMRVLWVVLWLEGGNMMIVSDRSFRSVFE